MAKEIRPLMIFLAGRLYNETNIQKRIESKNFDFYAADGGIIHAERMNLPLKRILGDFDSAAKPDRKDLLIYPSEKNETDSELALDLAIREGYQEIWMIAPFGGRLDHTIANLSLLEKAQESGVQLYLYDGSNLAYLLQKGCHTFDGGYRYFSFFAWKEQARISLAGFKYPLDQYCLKTAEPLGISNEAATDTPTASIHEGQVLCICIER